MIVIHHAHHLVHWFPRRWYQTIPMLVGIISALVCYSFLYDHLVPPFADEDLALMEPWRLAAVNLVYYLPLCLGQWAVFRRSIRAAWSWVLATIGMACIVQPVLVGLLWMVGLDVMAFLVWVFGVGSGVWVLTSQWWVLRQWSHDHALWLIALPFVWLVLLPVVYLISVVHSAYLNMSILVLWGLYQYLMSSIVLYILDPER